MMIRAKLKFRLHRTVIVLSCLAMLVVLMQGASWFSIGHQRAQSEQSEELARTLTRQVAWSLMPLMDAPDDHHAKIAEILTLLTDNSRILDAAVYNDEGSLVALHGQSISVRDRLALDGKRAGSYFNHQIVQPLESKDGLRGFLRVTLDTHVLATESRQVDNTTNVLRLMMLLSLAVGIILTRSLLRNRRTRWQQSPFLLTASTPLAEEESSDEPDDRQKRLVHPD